MLGSSNSWTLTQPLDLEDRHRAMLESNTYSKDATRLVQRLGGTFPISRLESFSQYHLLPTQISC